MTKNDVKKLLAKREENISALLDAILYYEKKEDDDFANHIVWRLFEINTDVYLEYLIKDLHTRQYTVEDNLYYNSIWYTIANSEDMKKILVEKVLRSDKKEQIITFLISLIKNQENVGEENIALLVAELNGAK